ncbi:MAG: hypothetical protein ABUL73_00295 [Alphaproteobacteria bacterium]
MRFLLFTALALLATTASANAVPAAQPAFAERAGLLQFDARCHVFNADVRLGVQAGAAQARGALLRGGWTEAQVASLQQAAASAADARACTDQDIGQAAARARASFETWARSPSITFTGGERAWLALRYPDPAGWRLRQDIPSPTAVFGVRESNGAQHLSFVAPLAANAIAPPAAQLVLRDPNQANANFDVPGRLARGLAANAPSPTNAQHFWANDRSVQTTPQGRFMVFAFPDAAFQALLALDPREAVEVRLGAGGEGQHFLVEVGDLVAARAFLAAAATR